MTEENSVGRRLVELRKERGMSLEELARTSGLQARYLMDVENGQILPSLKIVRRLASALGVPESQFPSEALSALCQVRKGRRS